MPKFNGIGELIGMKTGSVRILHDTFIDLVQTRQLGISAALQLFTTNPAQRLGLGTKKGTISIGADADLLVLNDDLKIDKVFAGGQLLVDEGKAIISEEFYNTDL